MSVVLLALAAWQLPIGTAYAVYMDRHSAVGALIRGIALFGDPGPRHCVWRAWP